MKSGSVAVLVAGRGERPAERARRRARAPGGSRRAPGPGARASRGWRGCDGGSGSFSMLANRNASGHDVNFSTRLGDRLVGTSNMGAIVRRGCHSGRRTVRRGRRRSPRSGRRRVAGSGERPKWSSVGSSTKRPAGRRLGDGLRRSPTAGAPRPARRRRRPGCRSTPAASQVSCRPPCSNVRASCSGSHFRRSVVARRAEPVAHVGVERLRVERAQRRLRRVVGDRRVERVEHRRDGAGRRHERARRRRRVGVGSDGKTIGSNSTSSRNSPGRRAAAISRPAPPIE